MHFNKRSTGFFFFFLLTLWAFYHISLSFFCRKTLYGIPRHCWHFGVNNCLWLITVLCIAKWQQSSVTHYPLDASSTPCGVAPKTSPDTARLYPPLLPLTPHTGVPHVNKTCCNLFPSQVFRLCMGSRWDKYLCFEVSIRRLVHVLLETPVVKGMHIFKAFDICGAQGFYFLFESRSFHSPSPPACLGNTLH